MNSLSVFIKKVAYMLGANLLSMIVSVITTLVIPKYFGIDISQYGYLQIYLFYVGYIGLFHLGWCDGVYLRDGGKEYQQLNKELYSGQFWLLLLVEVFLSLFVLGYGYFFTSGRDYFFISVALGINIIICVPRILLIYYLQTTNRIKEYASVITAERVVYGLAIVLSILFLDKNYRYFVWCDIVGKIFGFFISIWWCRDIVCTRPAKIWDVGLEAVHNIRVGIKLMFANIANMLITGIVRWGIQLKWDVATYGRAAFTFSVSNLLLTFISAIALVLYPTLRRNNADKLREMYSMIKDALMIPLLGCLIIYYPMEIILSEWLPQYSESMRYMAILFPMCIYAAKMTMLIQTYMNVFRLENKMLKVNIVGVIIAAITTGISVFWLHSLTLAMMSIVLNQMARCIYAEIVLARFIGFNVMKDTLYEILLTALFIFANWFVGGWIGVGIYVIAYIVYLLIKNKSILLLLRYVRG